MARYRWTNIDFLKMDAEGEETRIIEGGREFFRQCSPLVLYEVKAGTSLHLDLVREFASLGYDSYRLVPGLDMLTPFDAAAPVDGFLLNLFCCKRDRAAVLARGGLLAEHVTPPIDLSVPAAPGGRTTGASWERLTTLPYAAPLAGLWRTSSGTSQRAEVDRALAAYLSSQDRASSPAERFGALASAFQSLSRLCAADPSHLRRASLVRVAAEIGERTVAVATLNLLGQSYARGSRPDLSEPFLPVSARFDTVVPGDDIHQWILASILETLEILSAYSSLFAGRGALPRLETIESLGYSSEEMRRRLQLVRLRFPPPSP
jgi:hypothetical protein